MIKYQSTIIIAILFLILPGCKHKTSSDLIQISNVTIVSPYKMHSIVKNQSIIYSKDSILYVGEQSQIPPYLSTNHVVDGENKYLMAGLIDGFGTINNQEYANTYLKKGVTTIIGVESERRGPFYTKGNPSPRIYKLEGIGDEIISDEKMIFQIDSLKEIGIEVLLLMYKLTPHQVSLALNYAKKENLATIGELGFTTYKEAMEIGVEAFVHNTRYSLDIAPPKLAHEVALQPFSSNPKSPKWQYYRYLTGVSKEDTSLLNHAKNIGKSSSFLMPTLSLCYLDWTKSRNPWIDPALKNINPKDIHRPADPTTGKHIENNTYTLPYTNLLRNQLSTIEKTYHKQGAKYLIGSGADVWGTMPGISVHTEMELLNEVGLSNEEILCAATSNFNEAFGWKIGKIEKGYRADFIILKQNPIESLDFLNEIDQIILNGTLINLTN